MQDHARFLHYSQEKLGSFKKKLYLCSLICLLAVMWKTLLIVLLLVALAVTLLAVRIIVKRNGTFGSQDVGQSRAMRERGISCATSQDRLARKPKANRLDPKQL